MVRVFESTVTSLRVEVFDGDGVPIGHSLAHVGSKFLRNGFVLACASTAKSNSNEAPPARRIETNKKPVETRRQ